VPAAQGHFLLRPRLPVPCTPAKDQVMHGDCAHAAVAASTAAADQLSPHVRRPSSPVCGHGRRVPPHFASFPSPSMPLWFPLSPTPSSPSSPPSTLPCRRPSRPTGPPQPPRRVTLPLSPSRRLQRRRGLLPL
jgi:hypothetical protein